jgi:very-short-patch-repair endonuclease
MIDGELLDLFARQYGVAGVHQLAERGISRSAVHRARRRGIIDDVTTGVVRVRSTPLSLRGRAMAVQLRSGRNGMISGWTAGSLVGLRSMPTRSIHVTVPPAFRRAMPDWADVHRSAWGDAGSHDHHGFRLASPMRMLFGLAAAFNQHRFERAAEDAWHLELITPDEAARYLELHRCRGKDGVVRIERWLEHSCGRARPTQSNLERVLLDALEQTGLPRAQRQHPLTLATGETIHLDIAWPDIRLAVEPGSSWFHGGDLGQRRDQARDRACGEVGWLIVRFDDELRDHPHLAARQVARIYARRSIDVGNLPGSSR